MAPAGSRDVLQLLANPTNRAILSVLSLEPQYPRRLAEVVGLTEDEASKRLRLFEKAGLAQGTWAHLGKNVRLYKLATNQFIVHVDAQGLSVEGITTGSPVRVGGATEMPPRLERFQGRASELSDLANMLLDRPAACILGIGGSGKTALAARFAEHNDRPVIWHTLTSSESAPLLLGRIAAAQRAHDKGPRAQELLELRNNEDEDLLRSTMLESINETRSLVVLDRFEVAGETAAEEVAQWVSRLQEGRILLTSRTFPAGLPRDRIASLRVSGLSRADAQSLLNAYGAKAAGENLAEIYDRTHGHPLSLVLISQVSQSGHEARVERLLQESGIRDFFIDDVLPQLPATERDLLFALSVLRMPFTADEAEAVADQRHARHTLLKLENRGLLTRAGDTFLLHDLVRGFALEATPQPKNAHARAADALAKSGEPLKVLEAIHHQLESGAFPAAGAIILTESTKRTYRFAELGHAERYRQLLERLVAQERLEAKHRAACYLELAVLDTNEGEAARALRRLELVQETLGGVVGELRWPHLIARARLHRLQGEADNAARLYLEAEAEARKAKDERHELEVLVEHGFLEEERDDEVSFQIFQRAITLGRKTSDIHLLSLAYSSAARIGMRAGDDRHRSWAEEGLRLARFAGYLRGEVNVYMTLTTFAVMTGETKTGLEYSDRYLEIARRLGDPWLKACALSDKAMILNATEMYEQAIQLGLEALDLALSINSPFYEAASRIIVAEGYMGLGNTQKALDCVKKATELEVQAWPYMAARGWRVYARALGLLGQKAEARRALANAAKFEKLSAKDVTREWINLEPRVASALRPTETVARGPRSVRRRA